MAKEVNKLSALGITKLKDPGYYLDGSGLYLQISPSGSRSWIFKFTLGGKSREMGLGSLLTISLSEARDLATAQRKLLLEGKDPIEARKSERAATQLAASKRVTFDSCAAQYIEAHRNGWKNPKHVAQWENSLATYASPFIGNLWVSDVDTSLVLQCLEPIWNTKTETATRLRGRIEKILDWAGTRKYRSGENPARWNGHLEHNLAAPNKIAKVKHQPSLPYLQIAEFNSALQARDGQAPIALEFCILTAARSGEVRAATWSEIDFHTGVWTVPEEHMKMGIEHRVPLSARALEILEQQKAKAGSENPTGFIFPSFRNTALSDATLSSVIRRMNEGKGPAKWIDPKQKKSAVPHGFRSTFRDWAAECTTHESKLCEKALAHLVGDETERAYQRGDLLEKRRQIMEDWAKYCATPLGQVGNVLPIHKKTA